MFFAVSYERGIRVAKELLQKEHFENSTLIKKAQEDLATGKLKVLAK